MVSSARDDNDADQTSRHTGTHPTRWPTDRQEPPGQPRPGQPVARIRHRAPSRPPAHEDVGPTRTDAPQRTGNGATAPAAARPVQAGGMFALRWKTLPGSYAALIAASRANFAGPYAAATRSGSYSVMKLT